MPKRIGSQNKQLNWNSILPGFCPRHTVSFHQQTRAGMNVRMTKMFSDWPQTSFVLFMAWETFALSKHTYKICTSMVFFCPFPWFSFTFPCFCVCFPSPPSFSPFPFHALPPFLHSYFIWNETWGIRERNTDRHAQVAKCFEWRSKWTIYTVSGFSWRDLPL